MVARESAQLRHAESYVEDKIGNWVHAKRNMGLVYLAGAIAIHAPWIFFVAYTNGEGQVLSVPAALSRIFHN